MINVYNFFINTTKIVIFSKKLSVALTESHDYTE